MDNLKNEGVFDLYRSNAAEPTNEMTTKKKKIYRLTQEQVNLLTNRSGSRAMEEATSGGTEDVYVMTLKQEDIDHNFAYNNNLDINFSQAIIYYDIQFEHKRFGISSINIVPHQVQLYGMIEDESGSRDFEIIADSSKITSDTLGLDFPDNVSYTTEKVDYTYDGIYVTSIELIRQKNGLIIKLNY